MEIQKVENYYTGTKYHVKIERAASTKGVLGYTIEANGDDQQGVILDIAAMKGEVEKLTPMPAPELKKE